MLDAVANARRAPTTCDCGAPVPWGSHFCANCGRPVGGEPVDRLPRLRASSSRRRRASARAAAGPPSSTATPIEERCRPKASTRRSPTRRSIAAPIPGSAKPGRSRRTNGSARAARTPYAEGQEYCLECGQRLPATSGVVAVLGSAWRSGSAGIPATGSGRRCSRFSSRSWPASSRRSGVADRSSSAADDRRRYDRAPRASRTRPPARAARRRRRPTTPATSPKPPPPPSGEDARLVACEQERLDDRPRLGARI